MKYLKIVTCAVLSLALTACGGGGGSGGTPAGGTGGTGGGTTGSTVSSFTVSLSQPELNDSGSDKVTITVQALDANRNPVADATVTGAVDSGVFTPTGTTTGASGNFVGTVTIGADQTNRTITVTIKVDSITQKITIPVTGSVITMTPVPATPAPGDTVQLNLQVVNSAGKGIPGVVVTLGGTAGFTGTPTTDANGNVSASAVAPAAAGSYNVTAAGAGVTATTAVQVVVAGGSTIPAASGLGTSQSLTANPINIGTNATGVTTNSSLLTAKFVAADNTGIQYIRVRFDIEAPALGAGEYISTGSAIVYSDATGTATARYVAGTRTSPTNGVLLRACYAATDAELAADPVTGVLPCPQSVLANLTVSGQPLSIAIVNQNTMAKDSSGLFYQEQFGIQVADASGVAVKGAVVSASVDITHYGKGPVWGAPYYLIPVPDINFVYGNTYNGLVYVNNQVPTLTTNVWCVNEDTNRNGSLDANVALGTTEDINHNNVLDPSKSEIVLSYINGQVTDATGRLIIQVSYGQNMGGWLAYTIKATTKVVGSEGTKTRSFVTSVIKTDVPNGSFLTPPYGSGSCIDPN